MVPWSTQIRPQSDAPDVSLAERLAFERLLGDLSTQFADLPADRVLDEIAGALKRLIDFLGFDRGGFGEVVNADGRFEVHCPPSATASSLHRSARPRRCPGISASCEPVGWSCCVTSPPIFLRRPRRRSSTASAPV
jgi:hypothetical protein